MPFDAVLDAVVRAAVDATGATWGWVVARNETETGAPGLRVAAAAGGDEPGRLLDAAIDSDTGTVGLVVATGQPMAIVPRSGDATARGGVGGLLGIAPRSVLCVPCGDHEVLGALELIDKAGSGGFSFDDVELATLLAGVAGAALETQAPPAGPPSASELARSLEQLERSDPADYATVAPIVAALLARE